MNQVLKVYGIRPVLELLDTKKEIQKIYIQKNIKNDNIFLIKKKAKELDIELKFVPDYKLNKLTNKKHQGVFAISSPITFTNFENYLPSIFEKGEIPIFLLLDRITDVRNFGSISRSCEAFSAHGIIIPNKDSAPINEIAIKASAGSLTKIPISKSYNLIDTINFAKNSGLTICAMSEHSNNTFFDLDLTKPTLLILGSEKDGVSKKILDQCDSIGLIPITGEVQSLNVSVAAGIALSELTRQRTYK
ncbi:MAG: 23S rRNA (guanosine(2251)-2'-O)-methyltransferase RlmB [Flavobacteriales bacterium]|nr:23S rRNA (guanosine(2251)-2'-O)-methyltransferase RlmB [Flavobacteriales bacterium]|tara:strand:+ start:1868 stop:2608 length:741 start_codon:yes stop_codon:yes gene_type:complete